MLVFTFLDVKDSEDRNHRRPDGRIRDISSDACMISRSDAPGGIIEFSERLTDSATRTKGKAHGVIVQLAVDAKEALGLKFFWVGILGFVASERP